MNLYSLVSGLRFKLGMEILIFATDYFNSWCFSKPETGGLEILDSLIEIKCGIGLPVLVAFLICSLEFWTRCFY